MAEKPLQVGQRIKQHREELGWSLSKLAEEAKVSKGYVWSLEKGQTDARPSGRTLYRIAEALGVTMSDLLGRQLLIEPAPDRSPELMAFAKREKLPNTDIEMLASINFRGKRPATEKDWEFIYRAIRASIET
ncbi:MAG TPA: helix-turn-helix transcriptional regulator [Gaiellaceae bacterium]|nr:helix-turn-helix transcriptional regulator [Gaiellaceae bacterium]